MIENHVGCYETGSLDFFGPLCVVACYVDQKDEKELNALELDKEMSSSDIERIGKILKDKLTYSLLLLDNSHYNQYVNEGQKLSCIKAKLYNQAMINVIQRVEHPVSKVTIDAFLSPKKYYRYLKNKIVVVHHIEFKEEMSLAMKCARILSQYAYLQYYQNMCQSLNTTLPRGFNILANDTGTFLVQEYGKDILYKVSKTNFPNYKQILERVK
ncbi:ribonuclease HIII [Faecalibacillus faecis]|uniref:ribonuclease HIII n=1 Tax=Faecalibacillus faecis TaxID=1982628 RepID=UPI0018AC6AD1|nr:ribonuclease HIII [Faecalibacillus faecis]